MSGFWIRRIAEDSGIQMKNGGLISRGDVALRAMKNTKKDMELLLEWLNNPLVLQYVYGEDAPWDMEKVLANFAENTTGVGDATACFILYEGKEIGYLQYYPVQEDSYKYNTLATYEKVKGGYGVDMFIGIPALWNQGIGKQIINIFGEYCKKQLGIHRLCADPSTENERALKFWEKAGFVPLETIEDYDDSSKLSILMEKSI